MKSKLLLTGLAGLTLTAALCVITFNHRKLLATNSGSPARAFQVHGHIRGIDPAHKTLRIAHEEIPNYMPAMTMSLPVKNAALLQAVATGDDVQFELLVTADDSWISHIEKVPAEAPPAQATRTTGDSPEALEADRVQRGELVPDFNLADQDGRPIRLKEFRGKVVILTFVYTRCPLPNFCPLMSKNFAELEQRLHKEFPNQFQLLSISMDPEFDRPAVLKEYAARYGANPKDWSFATGDLASINFVAGLMGLYFERQNGLISHDLRTALIGPDGRLVQLWKSNLWTPYELQRSVREVLTGSADVASR